MSPEMQKIIEILDFYYLQGITLLKSPASSVKIYDGEIIYNENFKLLLDMLGLELKKERSIDRYGRKTSMVYIFFIEKFDNFQFENIIENYKDLGLEKYFNY